MASKIQKGLKLLQASDIKERWEGLTLIATSDSSEKEALLEQVALNDHDWVIRERALEFIDKQRRRSLCHQICKDGSQPLEYRLVAARFLEYNDPVALKTFVEAAQHTSENIRKVAISHLRWALHLPEVASLIVRIAYNDPNTVVKNLARTVLTSEADLFVDVICKFYLEQSDPEKRKLFLDTLRFNSPKAALSFVDRALSRPDITDEEISRLIMCLPHQTAVEYPKETFQIALKMLSRAQNPPLHCFRLIEKTNRSESVPLLLRYAAPENPAHIRWAATITLARLGDPRWKEIVATLDWSKADSVELSYVIAQNPDPDIFPILEKRFVELPENARETLLNYLVRSDNQEAIDAAVRLIQQHKTILQKWYITELLLKAGTPEAISIVADGLGEKNGKSCIRNLDRLKIRHPDTVKVLLEEVWCRLETQQRIRLADTIAPHIVPEYEDIVLKVLKTERSGHAAIPLIEALSRIGSSRSTEQLQKYHRHFSSEMYFRIRNAISRMNMHIALREKNWSALLQFAKEDLYDLTCVMSDAIKHGADPAELRRTAEILRRAVPPSQRTLLDRFIKEKLSERPSHSIAL